MVAEIEISLYDTFVEYFQDFIVLRLVNRIVEKLVFERNEVNVVNAEDMAVVESGHYFCLLNYTQVGFLIYN